MSIAPLLAAYERGNATLDDILAEYSRTIEQVVGNVTRRLDALETAPNGVLMRQPTQASALKLLDDAGWPTTYTGLRDALERSTSAMQPLFELLGYGTVTPSRRAFLMAVTMGDIELDAIRGRLGQVLFTNLAEAAISPVSPKTLVDVIQQATETSVARAKSAADTAIAGFQRDVAQQVERELPGEVLYLYIGPKDKRTRPFCKARAGKVFRRKDLTDANNQSGLPVMRYAGGYRCRHSIIPITRAIAEQRNLPMGGSV